ncbi:MAG: hypothetical protein M4579_005731 [Chaenotheca gracillima]|nr:MAG: hypothetical protein M4579_005731 [Chaenotheca gracillima]
MDAFWAAPPIIRTITAATLVTSLLVYSYILPAYYVVLFWPRIIKLFPEIWRFFTSFLLTGPQLGILFDPYFMYTYGSALESKSARFSRTSDFFTYVVFVWAVILATASGIFGGMVFTQAFTVALAYTYSQENRGQKVRFFIVTIPVQFLPFTILGMTLVMAGPDAAMTQASGLIAAHLYEFLTKIYPEFGGGRNFIQTPQVFRRWLDSSSRGPTTRAYGTAFGSGASRGASDTSRGSSSGISTGFGLSNLWNGRGRGQRLGGE